MKKVLKRISIFLSISLLISCFIFPCNALRSPEYWDEENEFYVNRVDNYKLDGFYIDINFEYLDNIAEIEADILSCEYVSEIETLYILFFEGIEDWNEDISFDDATKYPYYYVKLKDTNDYDVAMQFFEEKYYAERVWNSYYTGGDGLYGYYGDVNSDGNVNASDARQIMRYAVKLDNIATYYDKIYSDVNKDGEVTAADARLALRMSVKLEELEEIILENG